MVYMNETKQKTLFFGILAVATTILLFVGASFAYFTASINSEEGAINVGAAEFSLALEEDTSLIKTKLIPSAEKYIDRATSGDRLDENKNFVKPTKDSEGNLITKGTTCIDDNLHEICSIYTFTVINKGNIDAPLYITINPSLNTFENLYYKVLDENKNEVVPATHIYDDRYQVDESGKFLKDSEGNWIPKDDFANLKISPSVLKNFNPILPKASETNPEGKATYSIVLWIMEIDAPQNNEDSGKAFAANITVTTSGVEGKGITGTFSSTGTEPGN